MASFGSLGLLEGLGEGIQDAGKTMIADALEKDREARAEERQKAREEREERRKLSQPVKENATTFRNPTTGAWMTQDRNYQNQPLGSARPLDEWAASQRDAQEKADRQSLENATLTGKLNQFKLDRAPIEAGQDDEMFRARLAGERADTAAANALATQRNRPSGRSLEAAVSGPVNDTDVASALIDEQADLLDQYNLTPQQKMDLTLNAIRNARTAGKDPVDVLRRAIPSYVDAMKAKGYRFKSNKD